MNDKSSESEKMSGEIRDSRPCSDISSEISKKDDIVITSSNSDSEKIKHVCDSQPEPSNSDTETNTEAGVSQTCEEDQSKALAEGFYTMSAALHRAQEKLKKPNTSKTNDFDSGSLQKLRNKLKDKSNDTGKIVNSKADSFKVREDEDQDYSVDHIASQPIVDIHDTHPLLQTCALEGLTNTSRSDSHDTQNQPNNMQKGPATSRDKTISAIVAPWLLDPPTPQLSVSFTTEALQQLQRFSSKSSDSDFCLQVCVCTLFL